MDETTQNKAQYDYNHPEMKELRRDLRTYGTAAEAVLWGMLKNRQVKGLRWRRQFSVGSYVLDFYCPEKRLCIELDGNDHYSVSGMEHDQQRTQYLEIEHNIKILRFENQMVWRAPEIIVSEIEKML